jgi:glycosyltransferase 2 family protein
VGLLVLGWVAYRVDWSHVLSAISHAYLPYYLLALAFMFGQFAISSAKFSLLLAERDIRPGFGAIYRAYMVGAFISSFLPSRYSGDIYRGFVVARQSGKGYDSAAAVLLERATGLFALALIGFIASLHWAYKFGDLNVALSVAAGLGIAVVGSASLFSERLFTLVVHLMRLFRAGFLIPPAEKFHRAIMAYRGQRALFAKVLGLACVFYVESFAIMYFLLLAVGAHAPFVYLALVVPVVYMLEALPISVNGLGVREGAFFFFLSRIGIPSEQILAFSVLVLVNRTLSNLSGGIFLLTHPVDWKKQPAVQPAKAA